MEIALSVGSSGGIYYVFYPFAVNVFFDLGSCDLFKAVYSDGYIIMTSRNSELGGRAVGRSYLGSEYAFNSLGIFSCNCFL